MSAGSVVQEAALAMKKAQSEIVVWENNLASVQTKVQDLIRQKEELQKSIDQKINEANAHMAGERVRMEQERAFIASERAKLEEGKKELLAQIKVSREEKTTAEKLKSESDAMLAKAKYLRGNVDQFVTAVQRALSVLG